MCTHESMHILKTGKSEKYSLQQMLLIIIMREFN